MATDIVGRKSIYRQTSLPEGSRARRWEERGVADTHIQRSGEEGVEGGGALAAAASTCGF
jgi:hypothetical protein